jgi:hypothetical protein
MAFGWLGYAQHSGALPSGFVGEAFDSGICHSLEGKKREGAAGAAFSLKPTTNRELTKQLTVGGHLAR